MKNHHVKIVGIAVVAVAVALGNKTCSPRIETQEERNFRQQESRFQQMDRESQLAGYIVVAAHLQTTQPLS